MAVWSAERAREAKELETVIHSQRVEAVEAMLAQDKPYVCATCGKCFSAQADLKVHERHHLAPDAAPTSPVHKKFKTAADAGTSTYCWCKQDKDDDFVTCAVGDTCNFFVHKGCDGLGPGRAPKGQYVCTKCKLLNTMSN